RQRQLCNRSPGRAITVPEITAEADNSRVRMRACWLVVLRSPTPHGSRGEALVHLESQRLAADCCHPERGAELSGGARPGHAWLSEAPLHVPLCPPRNGSMGSGSWSSACPLVHAAARSSHSSGSPSSMSDLEFGQMSVKVAEKEDSSGPPQPHWYELYLQPCLAELVGSAFFIFIGCASVIENVDGTGRLQPALAHGLALGLTIAVLGSLSGGHYNPAVTLGVWLVGGLNMMMVIPYWIAQLCGGLIGAGLAKAMTPGDRYSNASGAAFTGITSDKQVAGAVVGEVVMSMSRIMVVIMGAVNERTKKNRPPFSRGSRGGPPRGGGGAVSGACMNPARAFGPALVAGYWDYHWVYWVGPIVAGLLVAALVRVLIGDKRTRLLLK
ncbi:hypothetical protein lerEdw1_007670, partial [Lerista edwardsae]